jgi:hypothetical protein
VFIGCLGIVFFWVSANVNLATFDLEPTGSGITPTGAINPIQLAVETDFFACRES